MEQQLVDSDHHHNPTLYESSHFGKYLPPNANPHTNSIISEDPSILCSPQNYMLLLSHCNSLQAQNKQLIVQTTQFRTKNTELTQKYFKIERQLRFVQTQNANLRQSVNQKGVILNSATTFGMVRRSFNAKTDKYENNSTHQHRKNNGQIKQFQRKSVVGSEQMIRSNEEGLYFSICLERELVELLKQQNDQLTKQIKNIQNQYQRILQNSIKWSKSEGQNKNQFIQKIERNYIQEIDIAQPFNRIKIELSRQKQNKQNIGRWSNDEILFLPRRSKQLPFQQLNQKIQQIHQNQQSSQQTSFNNISPLLGSVRQVPRQVQPNFHRKGAYQVCKSSRKGQDLWR